MSTSGRFFEHLFEYHMPEIAKAQPLVHSDCLTEEVLRRGFIAFAILTLTLFAVGGHYRFEGPTIADLGGSHGVHLGDLALVTLAAAALLAL